MWTSVRETKQEEGTRDLGCQLFGLGDDCKEVKDRLGHHGQRLRRPQVLGRHTLDDIVVALKHTHTHTHTQR